MSIVVPTTTVALFLGFGALQELFVPGIQGGGVQPFWVGAIGAIVCVLLIASSVALRRRLKGARGFAITVALLFIGFHLYASLPPHRNVGILAALVACAYGLGFLVYAWPYDRTGSAWVPLALVISFLGGCDRASARGCDGSFVLPDGFCAQLFAEDAGPARHVAVTASGDVYVARWREGSRTGGILALRDTNADGRADIRKEFGPEGGSGLALSGNVLFLGAWGKVYRWRLAESLEPEDPPDVVVDGIPELEHGARSIAIGPDSSLYVNIGVPSNACERDYPRRDFRGDDPCRELSYSGGIWRFPAVFGSMSEPHRPTIANRFATGLRHTIALTVDTVNGTVYGAPHGIDHLHTWWPSAGYSARDAAEKPGETLFRIESGQDYSFPYCLYDPAVNRMVTSPAYVGEPREPDRCTSSPRPLAVFAAHSAPLALVVYHGPMFPPRFRGGLFVALHGSLFRTPLDPTGYSVMFVPRRADGTLAAPESFADGLSARRLPLRGSRPRPSGLAVGPDGSLYVTDDSGGRIWRIVSR